MFHALGYSLSEFDPLDPGRLCRGRERWIDPYPTPPLPFLHRVVVSGATFSDDSARDARRGLQGSKVTTGEIVRGLFPNAHAVAWAEDAHALEVPAGAQGLEHYIVRRPGSGLNRWMVRWSMPVDSVADVDIAREGGADVFLLLAEPAPEVEAGGRPIEDAPAADAHCEPARKGGLPEWMREALFLLSGHRVEGPPARLYQPAVIAEILTWAEGLVLVHQDKHGPCLGIYARESLNAEAVLGRLTAAKGALCVPFAIPPMLARWDRALWELRQDWDERSQGEFPIPPAAESTAWRKTAPALAERTEE